MGVSVPGAEVCGLRAMLGVATAIIGFPHIRFTQRILNPFIHGNRTIHGLLTALAVGTTSENLRGSIPHAAKSTHPRSYLHGCG